MITRRLASRRGMEAPRRNVRIYRPLTIVLAAIASDIRKRPVRFHEWNGFAYNDRGRDRISGTLVRALSDDADRRAERRTGDLVAGDDKASFRRTATKIDDPPSH